MTALRRPKLVRLYPSASEGIRSKAYTLRAGVPGHIVGANINDINRRSVRRYCAPLRPFAFRQFNGSQHRDQCMGLGIQAIGVSPLFNCLLGQGCLLAECCKTKHPCIAGSEWLTRKISGRSPASNAATNRCASSPARPRIALATSPFVRRSRSRQVSAHSASERHGVEWFSQHAERAHCFELLDFTGLGARGDEHHGYVGSGGCVRSLESVVGHPCGAS